MNVSTVTPVPVFEYPIIVLSSDIDENEHANNVCYVRWMQDAATAHSAANGWTGERYLASGYAWVARRHTVEYLAPAFEGEEIIIKTWVADWKSVRSTRRYRFIRKKDGVIVAKAETLWAFISVETGRPIKLPKEVGDSFIKVDDPD